MAPQAERWIASSLSLLAMTTDWLFENRIGIGALCREQTALPRPACGRLRGEGWGEGLSPRTEFVETPPHPRLWRDLSPQAGRGEGESAARAAPTFFAGPPRRRRRPRCPPPRASAGFPWRA